MLVEPNNKITDYFTSQVLDVIFLIADVNIN